MSTKTQINFTFAASPEEISVDENIAIYKDVVDNYMYPLSDLNISTEKFEEFIEKVSKISKYEEFDYSKSKNQFYKKYYSDKYRIYARGNSLDLIISIIAKDEKTLSKIWEIYTEYTENDKDVTIFMTSYFINGGQLDGNAAYVDKESLSYISEKYYPYINTEVMFDQFFTGNENILLLVGNPGIGKSKLSTLGIKHAYNNPDKLPYDKMDNNHSLENQYISIAHVKSTDVLTNDKFWRELERTKPDICIIDDLDYMLTKRDNAIATSEDQAKNAFLNQFLSFTDGVEKNKTKFIITTNQEYADIDSAVLRKGRLFDILELRSLKKEEAQEIWLDNDLPLEKFNDKFDTVNVLPAELGSEIAKLKNTRIDNAEESYLTEENISKVDKAGRKKTVGV